MAKIVIVGGGLAGLTLARQFQAVGVDFHVLEARGRLGIGPANRVWHALQKI